MKLSLIFPVYNEAKSITKVLEGFSDFCDDQNIDHEILVVNDGSHDATSAKVKNFADTHKSVRLIEHPTNQGYGATLRSGFSAATGDFIFFTDSDGQFSPDDLDQTLPLIDQKVIVLGYRAQRAEGFFRRINAAVWNVIIRTLLGIQVRDVNCAWKVFPRTLLADNTLISRGAFINAELLYYAQHKKLLFREIPVRHFVRQFGKPTGANIQVIWHAFFELAHFLKNRAL